MHARTRSRLRSDEWRHAGDGDDQLGRQQSDEPIFIVGFRIPTGLHEPDLGCATGVAVGAKGSVFIGDDQAGVIYRIRP